MSINYSARLIYGVLITKEERTSFTNQFDDWEDIYSEWIFETDFYSGDGDIIIGITKKEVDEGNIVELGDKISNPSNTDINGLLNVLSTFGINRKPTWYLMCRIN